MKNKLLLLITLLTCINVTHARENPELKIVVFDVGHGDAMAIIATNGDAMIIDTGRKKDNGVTISEYLDKEGIRTVKSTIVTHYDADHIAGFPGFIDSGLEFKAVYDQGPSMKRSVLTPTGRLSTYGKYVSFVGDPNGNGIKDEGEDSFIRHRVEYGQMFYLGVEDEISVRVVSVRGDTHGTLYDIDLDPSIKPINENPGSVAVIIRYRNFEMYALTIKKSLFEYMYARRVHFSKKNLSICRVKKN